jgi:small subunit ribosomal protein S11
MEKKIKNYGILYLLCSKRNILGTLTNTKGQSLGTLSCGSEGFKGSQRGSFFASRRLGIKLGKLAKQNGIKKIWIRFRGKRENRVQVLLKGLKKTRTLQIERIYWDLRQPHNGCRPRKQRRR